MKTETGMKKLYLFDIDGTLITPGPAPRRVLNQAFMEVTGRDPDLQLADVAGFTDPLIVRNGLRRLGREDSQAALVNRILDRYIELLRREYPRSDGSIVYQDALDFCSIVEGKGHATGLLTGNIRRGAEIKLGKFQLFDRFPFGVFGDDGPDRTALPRIARDRARKILGETFRFEQIVIVGDTEEDCKIAVANGTQSVIVCRRNEWWDRIQFHRPTWLGRSLDDPELWATI